MNKYHSVEVMESGKHFTLRWLKGSGINIENVKLEYSPDNSTTYLPIAEAVPNTGSFEWFVPYHASPHCLIRISSADDNDEKQQSFDLLYEFKFHLEDKEFVNRGNDFTVRLGDAGNEMIQNAIPSLTFHHESDGKEYISFEDTTVELGRYEDFVHSLHTVQIVLDHSNKTVSVLLDGASIYPFNPAVSFTVGEGVELAIDDLNVKMGTAQKQEWYVLFNEDFERFYNEEQLKDSGWVQEMNLNQTAESAAMKIKILATDEHGQLSFPLFPSASSFSIQHSNLI
ncbi:MAG: hypothetical protein MUF15_24305 [Acidobacteria bacterium]|nr:hypothetical protein [Acidobacteriota bacterium]